MRVSRVSRGVDLLSTDDSSDDYPLTPVAEHTLPTASIPSATRRAIIVEKSNGDSNQIIALRYDLSTSAVAKVWKDFIQSTVDVRRLGDENPEIFKHKIRRKAVNAIENGLDCDKDPYRQGALGVQVMKGIGEFKADDSGRSAQVNILINSVPAEWKQRYISIESSNSPQPPETRKEE